MSARTPARKGTQAAVALGAALLFGACTEGAGPGTESPIVRSADVPNDPAPDDGTGDVPPPPIGWSEARALLGDLVRWDAAAPAARRAAAEEADSRLRDFVLVGLTWFEAGGARHQIAVFRHERTGLAFSLVPGGRFAMGSPETEEGRPADAGPLSERRREVTLSEGFLVAQTEVTQAAWRRATGDAPSAFAGDSRPVEQISWDEARSFCERVRLALPTEAQWEYACRAGTASAFAYGDAVAGLETFAWFSANAGETTHAVGSLGANAFGLYDVHGNVLEWCRDTDGPYGDGPAVDPCIEGEGAARIARGGSWFNAPTYARSAARSAYAPGTRASALGLRPVARLPR